MANKTRDMVVAANSTFPTVATQASTFQVNCNLANTCNAYYTGNTINFYLAGGGCANTAFGDVVAHEFGHNVVEKAGSGQGAYGEGMGDVHGMLLSDIPATEPSRASPSAAM
jgi:Zn-dependent metalloprotease